MMRKVEDKGTYIARIASADNLEKVNRTSKAVKPRKSIYLKYIKRIIDLVITVPVFIVVLPINSIVGVITLFDVGVPVFFKQERTGKDGKHFYLIKFRNMTFAEDDNGNLLPPSERVTKFGTFVRKYSLDELLNFWNIIKGDMSLIGPRPLPAIFDERYSDRHRMRNAVRPGLECPCIKTDNHMRFYQEQFENDIWYVENVSFIVDCKMFISLVKMVFNSKERGDHAKIKGGDFVGYNDEGEAFSMRRIPTKYEELYLEYLASFKNNKI
ncbi:sugar transferase [Eisenbergiella tayi]|uniref:Putative sugar transferase EpsL n=1 Tax=Eisenbergiella tayi TaxID=1432052 RepID=A0A1E3ADT8_9FIRM|nr:sugar transferase [Eisenbergiella tayi]ODM06819.1 putative sugar transferase EpsL [Eisenbergiella tayi]